MIVQVMVVLLVELVIGSVCVDFALFVFTALRLDVVDEGFVDFDPSDHGQSFLFCHRTHRVVQRVREEDQSLCQVNIDSCRYCKGDYQGDL